MSKKVDDQIINLNEPHVAPFPNPKNGVEKHANNIARQKRRAAEVKAKAEREKAEQDEVKAAAIADINKAADEQAKAEAANEADKTTTEASAESNDAPPDGGIAEAAPLVNNVLIERPAGMSQKNWNRYQKRNKDAIAAAKAQSAEAPVAKETAEPPPNETRPEKLNNADAWNAKKAEAAKRTADAKAAAQPPAVPTEADKANTEKALADEAHAEAVVAVVEVAKVVMLADGTVTSVDAVYDNSAEAQIISYDTKEDTSEHTAEQPAEVVQPEAVPQEPVAKDPVVEEPASTPAVETATPEPAPVSVKPDLKVVSDNTDNSSASEIRAKQRFEASKFYGDAFLKHDSEKLTDAFVALGMALKAESNGYNNLVGNLMKKALAAEAAAFATPLAKAG